MKIREILENISSGNFATIANPDVTNPYKSKPPKFKKPKMQKPTDNALNMKNVSIFGGPANKNGRSIYFKR